MILKYGACKLIYGVASRRPRDGSVCRSSGNSVQVDIFIQKELFALQNLTLCRFNVREKRDTIVLCEVPTFFGK